MNALIAAGKPYSVQPFPTRNMDLSIYPRSFSAMRTLGKEPVKRMTYLSSRVGKISSVTFKGYPEATRVYRSFAGCD